MIKLRVKAWALGQAIYYLALFSTWTECKCIAAINAKSRVQSQMARKEQAKCAALEGRAWTR